MSCCSACGQHACACGCGAGARTPRSLYNRPGLDSLAYRVGSYADFRATMQLDLSDSALPALAVLRTREQDDPAMALLDAWAVGAEVLSFYQERIANEGYLRTATERCSVLQLGRLVDYRLRPGVAASVYLAYTIDDNSPPVTIAAGAKAQSVPAPGEQMQTFETAEPLEARSEWNTLKPRLTQPQDISLDTVGTLGELWVAGADTRLKANDPLLFLFGELGSGATAVRRVQSVEVQSRDPATGAVLPPEQQRSRVVLQPQDAASVRLLRAAGSAAAAAAAPPPGESTPPASGKPGGFSAFVGALTLPPTLQPANSLRLARNIATALGTASDARPQLLLNFEARLADDFYRAWTSVAQGQASPALSGVYAMRVAAPLFGYNAPKTISLTQKRAHDGTVTTTSAAAEQAPQHEAPDVLSLDNAYDGVAAGGYLLIQAAPDKSPVVAQVQSVQVHPRTDYGISGKTTEIALANPGSAQPVWDISRDADIGTLRGTQVHAQSEPLPLAELTIADDLGNAAAASAGIAGDGAARVTLDAPVDGLKSGRWIIVQGQRSDVPGTDAVTAAEAVMVLAVEQGAASGLPGDSVHSTLVLANQGLAYAYKRGTVSIYANVVRATHGETRNEVLGNGDGSASMQSFALKQPPLTYVSAATVDGVQSTLAVSVNDVQWHEVDNLAFAARDDRSFVTATDDGGKTSVTFGDGAHGARLPTGVGNVAAVYRSGIGTPGNVQAGQISLLATKPLGVKNVVNPLRASGGADAETRDQARVNVPLAVLALDRLVSVPDYADFARTFGGVGKAVAAKLGGGVRVTIAGAADAPIDTGSDLFRNLLQALQRYGDPGLPVGLDVRELLALTLSARIGLAPDYAWESVEPQLRAALLDRFGFERRALAQNAYLSEIVACMQSVRGVAWVDVDAFDHLDEATVLQGLGAGDDGNDGSGGKDDEGGLAAAAQTGTASGQAAVNQRVQALPARYDAGGHALPAQIAYFLPTVPDTLLLQEAAP